MCSHLIASQLLNNGISFCKGGCKDKKLEVDPKLQAEIEDTWIPFTKDLLDSVLCFGLAVVSIKNKLPDAVSVETDTVGVYAHLWKMKQGRTPASLF